MEFWNVPNLYSAQGPEAEYSSCDEGYIASIAPWIWEYNVIGKDNANVPAGIVMYHGMF